MQMKVHQFLQILQKNKDKELLFAYQPNRFVKPNYHITEIKNVDFTTTDCGGKQNRWQETQMQLWEKPSEKDKTDYLTTNKAFSILNHVNSITPLWLKTELKIEYGNQNFHTAVLKIKSFTENNKQLIFSLYEEKTQCKANNDTNQICC